MLGQEKKNIYIYIYYQLLLLLLLFCCTWWLCWCTIFIVWNLPLWNEWVSKTYPAHEKLKCIFNKSSDWIFKKFRLTNFLGRCIYNYFHACSTYNGHPWAHVRTNIFSHFQMNVQSQSTNFFQCPKKIDVFVFHQYEGCEEQWPRKG